MYLRQKNDEFYAWYGERSVNNQARIILGGPTRETCPVTCSKTKIYAMLAESQQKTTFTQQTSVSDAKDESSQEKDVLFADQKLHQ